VRDGFGRGGDAAQAVFVDGQRELLRCARHLTSTNATVRPRRATRSISPRGVFTRRATIRQPCSRSHQAAQPSPRRPRRSASSRFT
jgi:hypothetical protein